VRNLTKDISRTRAHLR